MGSKAKLFNQQHAVGSAFIHQPNRALRGGPVVRTVEVARDLKSATVVEINVAPYFVNIESLAPVG
ncbi:TPA: hypothetical protein ACGD7V_002672 [Serratia marcescens]|uniref:hypothetical protein n=1 Tax=Serratia marcescens TaxID=615 RepID=UPI0016601430|nr:hypothetical protein [Serratia marcescens]